MKNKVYHSEVTKQSQNFSSDPQEDPCNERIVLTIEIIGEYCIPDDQLKRAAKQAINKHFKLKADATAGDHKA